MSFLFDLVLHWKYTSTIQWWMPVRVRCSLQFTITSVLPISTSLKLRGSVILFLLSTLSALLRDTGKEETHNLMFMWWGLYHYLFVISSMGVVCTQVEGIVGTYIANQKVPDAPYGASVISFDKGGKWVHLPPPAVDRNGTPIICAPVSLKILPHTTNKHTHNRGGWSSPKVKRVFCMHA